MSNLKEIIRTKIFDNLDDEHQRSYALAGEWQKFVEDFEPFTLYGHFTFRDDIHPEAAHKVWRRLTNHLNRQLFGTRYYKHTKGVYWIRATEFQKRGVLHYHAVIGGLPESLGVRKDIVPMQLVHLWFKLAGIARVYTYRQNGGAAGYITKSAYAWKNGDIELSDSLIRPGFAMQSQNTVRS